MAINDRALRAEYGEHFAYFFLDCEDVRVSPDAARRFLTIANMGDTGQGRFGEGEMG